MKKFIITTVIAACLALCTAVWPKTEAVEETPAPTTVPAVSAQKATFAELKTKVETTPAAEKETAESPKQEPPQEVSPEPEPAPIEILAAPEGQPIAEPKPAPEPTSEPSPAQSPATPPSGDMVYVEGFGWLEYQGPNEVIYAEDIYENGNKIGIMG